MLHFCCKLPFFSDFLRTFSLKQEQQQNQFLSGGHFKFVREEIRIQRPPKNKVNIFFSKLSEVLQFEMPYC